jgi:HSP20 family protein
MYRSLFPRDMFAELDRLQRDMQQAFDLSPTIRGFGSSTFPSINVGSTQKSLVIVAFAPGLDPAEIDVKLERGLLTISGKRRKNLPTADAGFVTHIHERFEGDFHRVLTLPDDADPEAVEAVYRDGVLQITVQRRAAPQPRRVAIQ